VASAHTPPVTEPTARAEPAILLATSLNYWRYARLTAPEAEVEVLPKAWTRERRGRSIDVAGWWGRIGTDRAAVFARGGELHLHVGQREWTLDPSWRASHECGRWARRLIVSSEGGLVVARRHRRPARSVFHLYDNWADEGDYDFGAFIAQIVERATTGSEPKLLDVWPFRRELAVPTQKQ
jgi:hypothetical protein